eukprot:4649549-Pyramimonas_sp.AAC.1
MRTFDYSYFEKVCEMESANQNVRLSTDEQTHFSGSSRIDSVLMICPCLVKHMRAEVEREAALATNLRIAREAKEA